MLKHYYAAPVLSDENGTRADFDPVYSPPLVYAGVVGDIIPEGDTVVVVWATCTGLSDDMAEQVVAYWDATYTKVADEDFVPEPTAPPVSKKVALPVAKAEGDTDMVYLGKVMDFVAEKVALYEAELQAKPAELTAVEGGVK